MARKELDSNFVRAHARAVEKWDKIRKIYQSTELPILFYGPPGSGKTAFPVLEEGRNGRIAEVFNVNKFSSKPDILGHFISTSAGSEFCLNAGARAMIDGRVLVLNEIDHGGPEIMSTFHFICDHQTIARETLPDGKGTVLAAKRGYRVIGTMNGDPVNLPLAIRDRFQIKILVDTPNPEAVDTLPLELKTLAYVDGVTLRNLIAMNDLMKSGSFTLAESAKIVFGKVAEELAEALSISAAA